ncbi:cell wall-associated NlpC family hydrolase [Luteibacter sp. Sphag1AF]|uniref:YiiX/YebB-like N1pC/P60 family cysteine hydrolase n=1 Tax=Luteibacter sp. Sphag1AF TaxID=2587031 RepID=UPI0017FA9760|nr:YiiX/YebB-like N1pC/P60 family cysteine hydrolase [Luteibacter sp. Sphag1AF]MBB3226140.1 cell wall-associated NlpC family hydrolase [Luteibacter sp. Sphag1AF]
MSKRHAILAAGVLALASLTAWRYLGPSATAGSIVLPAPVVNDLQAGDLIFREGREPVSDAVRAVDMGGYSHVGMLLGSPGHWQVVHAVPAEQPDRIDGVVDDSLDDFLLHARARRVAVVRVEATPSQRLEAVAHAQARRGTPFRVTADGTYCTELVWRAYQDSGVDLRVRFEHMNLPLLTPGDYLLPSALLASPRLTRLYESPES